MKLQGVGWLIPRSCLTRSSWLNLFLAICISLPLVGGCLDPAGDADGDGVVDMHDNCRVTANADQADLDGDRVGDACDNCPPSVCSIAADCHNPRASSPKLTVDTVTGGQLDTDADGLGDACDLDLAPWEVAEGSGQASCPDCPIDCAGLNCAGSPAAGFPVGVATVDNLERACNIAAPRFSDAEVTPGCHPVCDLDGDGFANEWCRKVDIVVHYPALWPASWYGDVEGPASAKCGYTERDSCEANGCMWTGNQTAPAYYQGEADFRCLKPEAIPGANLAYQAFYEPLPVVVLSHGTELVHTDFTHLAVSLANKGFVVVSMSHPGNEYWDRRSIYGGAAFRGLAEILHSLDPTRYPLLEQNPYCNAYQASVLQQYGPILRQYPSAANFDGFATKQECFANSCAVWDDVTGCDADYATEQDHSDSAATLVARNERSHDVSDVLTWLLGGQLYDSNGARGRSSPDVGWNQTGNWPWRGWNYGPNGGVNVLDADRVGMVGHSAGGLTAIAMTTKAAYDGYQPGPLGPLWDMSYYRDDRVKAVLALGPGIDPEYSQRVWFPLAVPTMIQVGLYDYITPYSDHINGERTCPFVVSSELDVDGPICSVQGAYNASQFDAVELEAQGLVSQPDDPPRFLLRLDTAGHGTFVDKYSMDFNITCPADPTLPCSCVNDFVSSYFGPAECGQLSGDRAPAEELIFANARSFFGAFLQGNPSAWQVASGDQTSGIPSTVTGHLFADWDRDASDATCGGRSSDLLGDGVLDSVDNCGLVCNADQTDTDGDGVGDACAL